MFAVPKKNTEELRLVVNYKKMVPDATKGDLRVRMGRARIFSTIDEGRRRRKDCLCDQGWEIQLQIYASFQRLVDQVLTELTPLPAGTLMKFVSSG